MTAEKLDTATTEEHLADGRPPGAEIRIALAPHLRAIPDIQP